jgi:hypothetical protein
VNPAASDSAPATDSETWTMERTENERPWSEMWAQVQRNFKRIERRYTPAVPAEPLELDTDVLNFTMFAYHLCEHIEHDELLPKKTRNRITDAARKNAVIAKAGDLANTSKHYKRSAKRNGSVRRIVPLPCGKLASLALFPRQTVDKDGSWPAAHAAGTLPARNAAPLEALPGWTSITDDDRGPTSRQKPRLGGGAGTRCGGGRWRVGGDLGGAQGTCRLSGLLAGQRRNGTCAAPAGGRRVAWT